MAGNWIQMRHDLPDDPDVIHIACQTGVDEFAVIGRLHKLWSWADRQTIDGNAPSVTVSWLDRYLECAGFAAALIGCDWLQETENGIRIPKFDEYISESAKQRALTARRARRYRRKSNAHSVTNSNAPSVTKSAPKEEKRREEKSKTPLTPQDKLPPELDTPEFGDAWAEWAQHRREIKKNLTPTAVKRQISKLVAMGHERAVAAIHHSIAQSYTGIYEPGSRGPGNTNSKTLQTGTAEWLRKKREAQSDDDRGIFGSD